jgi:2-keto-3-deoxy-L-rhamnonate aldolase RhmA
MLRSSRTATAIRQRIVAGELTVGSWITLGHPGIAEIMALAGADWVVIDLEHSVIELERASEMIRAVDLNGASPLVRLTSNDPNQAKRVMDAGAHGIIVPMVNSADEAARAVAATPR